MFEVIKTIRQFDRRGNVATTTEHVVFTSADPVECLRFRYDLAKGGHLVSCDEVESVSLATRRNGKPFEFSEMFRLIEGQAAYDAVMNGERGAQNEQDCLTRWTALPTIPAPAVKLTAKQAEVMHHYSDRVGETFDVLCGYLTNAVNPEFRPVGPPTTMATLRGLETKGLIRIVDSFWKGATVTVLKAA